MVAAKPLVVAHFTQPPSAKALLNYLQSKFPDGEYYSAYEAGFSGTEKPRANAVNTYLQEMQGQSCNELLHG